MLVSTFKKKDDRECNEITIACTGCKQQKTRYRTKTRDSLKQHMHKQKAPAHQTVTRNYKIATYRGITFASNQAVQYHHINCHIQSIKFATKKGAPEP